jgi:hypothetical protein
MSRKLLCLLAITLVGTAFAPALRAQETLGYLAFDSNAPGTEFDILNSTGPDDFISPDANPVTTTVDLSNLTLVVSFLTGPNETFNSSSGYFSVNPFDTISFVGTMESNFTGADPAVSATLTGTLSPTTLSLEGLGTPVTTVSTFSATVTDATGLEADIDFVPIVVNNASSGPPPVTPEPESLVMVATGIAGLAGFRRRFLSGAARKVLGSVAALACVGLLMIAPVAAHAAIVIPSVTLTSGASPASVLAGGTSTVTGASSSFPGILPVASTITASFETSCGGTVVGTSTVTSVAHYLATTDHFGVNVPGTLTSGDYFIALSGGVTSVTCSEIAVTATSTTLAACVPTSSLGVVAGSNVDAYVPFAYWDNGSTTGIELVPLEGSDTAKNFATSGGVNSCAANSSTGEVVCTENTANVDIISGGTLSTITSGSSTYAGFSGGDCENCGVGINAANNTAVIAMGISGSPSDSGVQVLNLSGNTFNTAVNLSNEVSEDVSIDSSRNLILSPSEDGTYDLLKIGSGSSITEYGQYLGGTLDSAAEDCTTGIAMAADEFTDDIYITDLTQATFTAGTPGTWSAPGQFINLSDGGYSAGTCGISSAPGTGHLAVVTGEFGGSAFSALQLPSTSGSGTPALADYAYVSSMPNTPDGSGFSAGYDPHTVTAYTSPNNSKAYAVFADYAPGYPDYLGVVDLACVLALPRTAGTHNVTGSASACVRYVSVP